MQQTKFDYQKARAAISLNYGIELDDTSLTILSILSAHQKKNFATQNKILESATAKISVTTQSLQAHQQKPGWQAFWYGMGKFGLALIFAISIVSCLFIFTEGQKQEQEQLPVLLQWYKAYYEASQMSDKKIVIDFLKNNPKPEEK